MIAAHDQGLDTNPVAIAELGPGNSLGPGLAGILCGASRLYAFDVVNNMDIERNLLILEQLVELFSNQEPIPDENEFPGLLPALTCYDFPSHILSPEKIRVNLQSERIAAIKAALRGDKTSGVIEIKYYCPWHDSNLIQKESVDMIYSNDVLEHVDDLEKTYNAVSQWLKTGGYLSHVIDFSSHTLTKFWNGHWRFSDLTWKLIRGRKPYLLNREPCSKHLSLLNKNGFELVSLTRSTEPSELKSEDLDRRFRLMSDTDLTTRLLHVIAKKSKHE
jgi:SAM-dependent methyltransferase